MAFHYYEDFKLRTEKETSYKVNVYRVSAFTHEHCKIMEDGKYHILLEGCKHYLATPKLKDFTFRTTFDLVPYMMHFGHGAWIFFRYDKNTNKGHALRFYWDPNYCLHFELDGEDFFTRQDEKLPDLNDLKCLLSISGNKGHIEVLGLSLNFDIPAGEEYPEEGYVAMDLVYSPSAIMRISSLELDSPDPLPVTHIGDYHYRLARVQGFEEPLTYDVALDKYSSGEILMRATLSGTIMDRGERKETGGSEWGRINERLTSPYLRIESHEGEELHQIFFYRGTEQLYDRHFPFAKGKKKPDYLTDLPWPYTIEIVLSSLPEKFIMAAGYEHAANRPWVMMENGPYEQIRDENGTFLYEGDSLRRGQTAFRVFSSEKKKIVSMIPKDIPRYEDALNFAKKQHFFFESEKISFVVEALFREEDYEEEELKVEAKFTSVYGEDLEKPAIFRQKLASDSLPGNIHSLMYRITLENTPSCGVWHLVTKLMAGEKCLTEETTIFDVLSDDPEGPCPPLASKLPVLISMPNETKYLESNCFDPWNEFCGMGHYYTGDNRYPLIGTDLQVHRLLDLYRRRWFCWVWGRNSGDKDMFNEYNRNIMRNAWYFGGSDNRYSNSSRYDFNLFSYYRGSQLKILRDFVAEKNPPLKLLTLEKIDQYIAEEKTINFEEMRDLFETCWVELKEYGWAKVDEQVQDFCNYLFSINPKLARGSYGPNPIYVQRYKSAYMLGQVTCPIEKDPRIRENGSFWFLEDYHFSCDYPLCRSAFFVASYDFYYSYSRYIYPEIYYQSWARCEDGAVYQAHPIHSTPLSSLHQKRLVYQFTYGTPQFKKGTWKYWTDYGFHARNPEKQSLKEFVYAWGKMIHNEPKKAPKSPFLFLDLEQLKRRGDYFEDQCNFHIEDKTFMHCVSDINNTGEEALGYTNELSCADGRVVPVMTNFDSINDVTKDMAEFLILPPIVESTPKEIIDGIRAAYERGIPLLAFESVCGLEDLFGVKADPAGERKVGYLFEEPFEHKMAKSRYIADGANCILYGAENAASPLEIPIVFCHETEKGRAVLVNAPPTVLRRSSLRSNYNHGQDGLSTNLRKAMKKALAFLSPLPAIKTSRGSVCSAWNEKGELIVILSDDSPVYKDTSTYPAKVKLTLRIPGIGKREISADTGYTVLVKEEDKLVILTETLKDDGLFFKFI